MAGRLRGWRALSWTDRGGLLALMLALPLIATALHLLGYRRTRHWLERKSPDAGTRRASPADLASAERLAALASIAGRHGAIEATCLRQSLVVYWLLRRRGMDPRLQIEVRRRDAAMVAHAWVELDGVALAQGEIAHSPFAQSHRG